MSAKSTGHLLSQLRQLMVNSKYVTEPLHAYIIPSGDAHQSEYIAPRHKRREFISGFTGSAGTVVVTKNEALLWTDGRYFLQAEKELDHNWTLMKDGVGDTLKKEDWFCKKLPANAVIGVDPWLLSLDDWRSVSQALKNSDKKIIRVDHNLVDLVWGLHGQPDQPQSEVIVWNDQYAGKSWQSKVEELQETLKEKDVYGVVIAALDEVAWLFNLRGADISFNPVFMSFAIVTTDGVRLYLEESRVTTKIKNHLSGSTTLDIRPYSAIQEDLRELGTKEKKIWISSKCSCALASLIPEQYLVTDISPVCMAKAVKNKVEIEGMKKAHIRDAAALCEYLCWLEENVHKGGLDELTAAHKLDALRAEQDLFVSLSFDTISAAGPNGAVIHYRPTESSSRIIQPNDMYLCDSGGQYLDGTTDVTRTIHLGEPTSHQKECFTRVLKGHIQLASTVFPNGICGHILDILARKSLWDIGLDYVHGTGHGVGAFLNVHEGPIGISPRKSNDQPLLAGMFLSDEPGYYEDNSFGIRIESILLTKEVKLQFRDKLCDVSQEKGTSQDVDVKNQNNYNDRGYLGFEPVTLVPIQRKLLDANLLTQDEITWLNDYHENVFETVGSYLKESGKRKVLDWLIKETQSIG